MKTLSAFIKGTPLASEAGLYMQTGFERSTLIVRCMNGELIAAAPLSVKWDWYAPIWRITFGPVSLKTTHGSQFLCRNKPVAVETLKPGDPVDCGQGTTYVTKIACYSVLAPMVTFFFQEEAAVLVKDIYLWMPSINAKDMPDVKETGQKAVGSENA